MAQVVIENPVLNPPFSEPARHFKFSDEGITDEIVPARRVNSYFVPIARPKKKGKAQQLAFETEWTQDRVREWLMSQQSFGRLRRLMANNRFHGTPQPPLRSGWAAGGPGR